MNVKRYEFLLRYSIHPLQRGRVLDDEKYIEE